ncbi:MAG: acylneuraminate cytidylyltransferase [Candidatus Cloacimonetes bacterium]|nr:acylneuraminate cytidylyltransferase [Candidatus Cloacimonadota bacterium]
MQIIAIIPARGGSKGISRKNLVHLAGKPLLTYTVEAAFKSELINRVIVSTDDKEISTVAQQCKAEVVWRPEDISGDLASSESALLHVLEFLKQNENYVPEVVVFLQTTSPLTLSGDIDGAIKTLLEQEADSVLTVTPFHHFLWQEDNSNTVVGINHDMKNRKLRQDLEPQYLETGAVYVMKTHGFIQSKHRFFGKTVFHEILRERYIEIDELIDLEIAEILVKAQKQKLFLTRLPDKIEAIVFDFDGVFTNNKAIVDENGKESVIIDRGDGQGISLMREMTGIHMCVISTEKNPVVAKRCLKLKLPVIQGIDNKKAALIEYCHKNDIDLKNVAFVGNDINDKQAMGISGVVFCPADAHEDIKVNADYILKAKGGEGVIRELADLMLKYLEFNY